MPKLRRESYEETTPGRATQGVLLQPVPDRGMGDAPGEGRQAPVSGVYAILGPNGVYVGESCNCWTRGTLELATKLGWECGIVREMPGAGRLLRIRAEADVAKMFRARGFVVVSAFLNDPPPKRERFSHHRPWASDEKLRLRRKRRHTTVSDSGDHLTIMTTFRRYYAILHVISGSTIDDTGREFGVTRQRIHQFISEAKIPRRCRLAWGCTTPLTKRRAA